MPRLQALLECVGQALCEKGPKALRGQWPYADVLFDVAKAAFDLTHRRLPGPELGGAFADLAACPGHEYDRRVGELIADLSQTHRVPAEALADYLRAFPATVRQILRRPSDPHGHSAPEKLSLYKPEELLPFLPPRAPRFRAGDRPPGLDNWTLTELHGLGECSEVWRGEDPDRPDESPAALKFAIDPDTQQRVVGGTALFTKVFDLNPVAGALPLRSVYLETDPPCLEAPFVSGYDLAGLMFDWKWRYDTPKPEAALKLIRRLTAIVAEAHARGVVHRDLKPSNVLLHPTEDKKFTMWVTDFGWGQIESVRSLELARLGPKGEQHRLAFRGAATVLYASPQQAKKEPPAQADDVHALGVMWFQLLKREPSAAAPVGTEWVEDYRPHGFTDSQARVLQSCLSTRPDRRPRSAAHLLELLGQVTVGAGLSDATDGSKLLSLRGSSPSTQVSVKTAGGRGHNVEANASQAAALLAALGDAGPPTGSGSHVGLAARLVKNSIGMTFVRVPAGAFKMGSPPTEAGRRDHEGPDHDVRVTRPFYLSVHPVTQAQYERVMGKNPATFCKARGCGPDHPVETVGWRDAEAFCVRLAGQSGEAAHNRGYRLPTEAEWEYACRAGTTTAYSAGDKLTTHDGVTAAGGGRYAGKTTAPVGASPANAFGLYDMHGNVQEWVSDWYEEYYYFDSPADDPAGPGRGLLKVARGGCWHALPSEARSAARRPYPADTHSDTLGFRVVLVVG